MSAHQRPEPEGDLEPAPTVRIVTRDQLSSDTPQTPGLLRQVALDSRVPGVMKMSAFVSSVSPGAATGAHHHGDQETILYVLTGIGRFRWGNRLEHLAEAGPGSFVFIPSGLIHQEINPSTLEATEWVVVRSAPDPIVVNLPDLDYLAEKPAVRYENGR